MAINKLPRSGIADSAVTSAKVGDGLINAANEFPDCQIASTRLADCAVTNAKLSNSAITIRGTSTALGASLTVSPDVNWQSVVVSDGSTVTTMVAGRGYFVNNASAAGLVKLPSSASIGDTIKIKDYAANFGTNNLTIQRNSHNIQGNAVDATVDTNRASLTAVYVDSTKGWIFTDESNVADLQAPSFISATGGTATTSGDYKIHTFTGDGNFVVSSLGGGPTPCAQSSKVDYLVAAGGGGGGAVSGYSGGGAGGGGFREGKDSTAGSPHAVSPLAATTGVTVSASPGTYPVTVGGGGSVGSPPLQAGNNGSNSVFSTITSTGGGGGGGLNTSNGNGKPGGSGGGGGYSPTGSAGSGNTPPVSPSQGNNGGSGGPGGGTDDRSGGGGGATQTGTNSYATPTAGDGGDGATTSINGSPTAFSGGGGGGGRDVAGGTGGAGGGGSGNPGSPGGQSGTANTGGGAAGASPGTAAGTGGSGIVIIRYKYQ